MRTCVCAQQSLHRAFGANQWHSRTRFIRLLFLQLVLDFNKLVGELGQVRPRLVRATADVGVCALAKCSWSVAKHKGIHRLTTVPLRGHLRNPFHLKGKRAEECPSIPRSLCHRFGFSLSRSGTQMGTHASTEVGFKVCFIAPHWKPSLREHKNQ